MKLSVAVIMGGWMDLELCQQCKGFYLLTSILNLFYMAITVLSSPFAIVVTPASGVSAERSVASGLGVSQTVEGCTSRFQLQLKDVYSNPIDAPLVCNMLELGHS